jgi:hypothetical protein
MKVLMLVISSDNEQIYAEHRKIWSSYMNSSPNIDCYFIQYGNESQKLDGNILWLTGKESFNNIIRKTVDSIEYFLNLNHYDFIIRTNLSSFWNFNSMLRMLETLPKEKIYAGFIGNHNGIPFASGSGFILTADMCNLLIKHKDLLYSVNIIDDVDIGYTMRKLGIFITPRIRSDFFSDKMYKNYVFNPNVFHYRIKCNNRYEEIGIMNDLLVKCYSVSK